MTRGRADFVASESADVLRAAVGRLAEGFGALPPTEGRIPGGAGIARLMEEVADRLQDNYPYFHPLYAGQMLKPPHPAARLAYALAMWINPNNHALDGGRASSAMEKEAVAGIAAMFGWKSSAMLGHLCGGGTMANLEALWVAGRLRPGETIVASSQAHYTHGRISAVLGLPFEAVPSDRRGRMDVDALRARLARGSVGAVVATILALRDEFGFRLHADAAYGGYFGLADNLAADGRTVYARLGEADSIVIDPHKHGLQPYGCGCVLFRDPSVGRFYKHDSPYTYFSSDDLHLGEITLECSRPGASAVALWATQRLLPLEAGGEFAAGLSDCRAAALTLHAALDADPRFVPAFDPELDIVVWIPRERSATAASARSRRIFEEAAKRQLHLALAELPAGFFDLDEAGIARDRDTVTALRSVLMKPEHREWVPRILGLLGEAADAAAR